MSILGLKLPLYLWLLLFTAPAPGLSRNSIVFFGSNNEISKEGPGLNDLRTADEFLHHFNMTPSRIHARIQGEYDQAGCTPEPRPVPLDVQGSSSSAMMFFPTCIRIERCGGCCLSSYHSCQPLRADVVPVSVIKVEMASVKPNRRRRVRKSAPDLLVVEVERHLECACQCIVQPGDCDSAIQTYDPQQCDCVCKNSGQESECFQSASHFWNSNSCECLCRNPSPCSSGQTFDHNTCSCLGGTFDYEIFLQN